MDNNKIAKKMNLITLLFLIFCVIILLPAIQYLDSESMIENEPLSMIFIIEIIEESPDLYKVLLSDGPNEFIYIKDSFDKVLLEETINNEITDYNILRKIGFNPKTNVGNVNNDIRRRFTFSALHIDEENKEIILKFTSNDKSAAPLTLLDIPISSESVEINNETYKIKIDTIE